MVLAGIESGKQWAARIRKKNEERILELVEERAELLAEERAELLAEERAELLAEERRNEVNLFLQSYLESLAQWAEKEGVVLPSFLIIDDSDGLTGVRDKLTAN